VADFRQVSAGFRRRERVGEGLWEVGEFGWRRKRFRTRGEGTARPLLSPVTRAGRQQRQVVVAGERERERRGREREGERDVREGGVVGVPVPDSGLPDPFHSHFFFFFFLFFLCCLG